MERMTGQTGQRTLCHAKCELMAAGEGSIYNLTLWPPGNSCGTYLLRGTTPVATAGATTNSTQMLRISSIATADVTSGANATGSTIAVSSANVQNSCCSISKYVWAMMQVRNCIFIGCRCKECRCSLMINKQILIQIKFLHKPHGIIQVQ